MCRLSLGSELRLNKLRFRTKSLGVDLYYVQDKFTQGRLSLGSDLELNKFRFRVLNLLG